MLDIAELIKHPEQMDRDTLYELRSTLALYPYFQTARLLLLQNLYLLHDPSFDEELRRAAIYITDRKVIFQMIEAGHYQLEPRTSHPDSRPSAPHSSSAQDDSQQSSSSRTLSLIDNFLESLPKDDEASERKSQRKPTPADAAVDYVAYLLETEGDSELTQQSTPQLRGQSLIDEFINSDKGKIVLNETPTLKPDIDDNTSDAQKEKEVAFGTETLARIYIKQGRYSQALEIIRRISLENPKKNAYFADQIRFLQKLIINNKQK